MCKQWKDVWSYTQQDYRSSKSVVNKQLQNIRIKSNHNCKKIRIKFSNIYGLEDIDFSKVLIRIFENNKKKLKAEKTVTYKSNEFIKIPCGKEFLSDELEISIKYSDIIEFETILNKKTILSSGTVTYCRIELEIENYDYTDNCKGSFLEQKNIFQLVMDNNKMCYFYGISGLEMNISKNTKTIVAFGDSLTQQGFWVENLKNRFFKENIRDISILNRGIGGNRILNNTASIIDTFERHGIAGLKRFKKEIPNNMKIDYIIIFHGINDLITISNEPFEKVTLDNIISGLIYYSEEAKKLNSKVYISTLLPMKNSIFFNKDFENDRIKLNDWIRKQNYYDGVIDFEKIVKDQNDDSLLYNKYDSGDGLHLSNEGGKALADSIDLEMFDLK